MSGVIQIERAVSIGGNKVINPGITFLEHHEDIDIAIATLQKHGVKAVVESEGSQTVIFTEPNRVNT